MPVWHCSVALRTFAGPKLIDTCTDQQILRMIDLATRPLNGCGVLNSYQLFVTPHGTAMHAQKRLAAAEIKMLPQRWMEIPAVDELGPIIEIDPVKPLEFRR